MVHARDHRSGAARGAAAIAVPRPFIPADRRRLDLCVDLAAVPVSPRWWRGAATLGLLCTAAALLVPAMEPLRAAPALPGGEQVEADALAIAPLSAGGRTGLRMAADEAVEPVDVVPERPTIELILPLGQSDSLVRLLLRAGATQADAAAAAALITSAAAGRIAPGTKVAIRLGARTNTGARPIERVALRAGFALDVTLSRGPGGGFALQRRQVAVTDMPLRVSGRAGVGLYWSLRAAGASPDTAAEYLKTLAQRIDVGEIGEGDRFDLVIAGRRSATGESETGGLLYAAIDRMAASDVQLVRWAVGGKSSWIDVAGGGQTQQSGLVWPVAGRITSSFGYRLHPILRYTRLHAGLDFGAGWGSPIVAPADGQVIAAGWAGGYGRQVRIAHGGGTLTTYSHMSRIVAEPGAAVRAGEVIGYVGSSGLSTGPHLHFEVIENGRKVDPLGARFASRAAADPAQMAAVRAKVRQLLNVGVRRG